MRLKLQQKQIKIYGFRCFNETAVKKGELMVQALHLIDANMLQNSDVYAIRAKSEFNALRPKYLMT